MSCKRMELGGAGPSEIGKTTKKTKSEDVQVVGPESAERKSNSEQIDGCCTSGPVRMYGQKS